MFIKIFYYPLGVVAILGIIMSAGLASTVTAATSEITAEDAVTTPYSKEEVINLINEARQSAGLKPVIFNETLAAVAQAKADDMVARNYFSHSTPDGKQFWNAILTAGYDYRHAGENLAVHYNSADALVQAWLGSPTHRQNIMTTRFTETGIGLAYGEHQGHEGWFIVQTFGNEF